jgi:hypothetical protein
MRKIWIVPPLDRQMKKDRRIEPRYQGKQNDGLPPSHAPLRRREGLVPAQPELCKVAHAQKRSVTWPELLNRCLPYDSLGPENRRSPWGRHKVRNTFSVVQVKPRILTNEPRANRIESLARSV